MTFDTRGTDVEVPLVPFVMASSGVEWIWGRLTLEGTDVEVVASVMMETIMTVFSPWLCCGVLT